MGREAPLKYTMLPLVVRVIFEVVREALGLSLLAGPIVTSHKLDGFFGHAVLVCGGLLFVVWLQLANLLWVFGPMHLPFSA